MTDPLSFTSASPRLGLPLLFAGQAQKEFFVNEALARIDALLHCAIEGEADVPPASPAEGECWLVGIAPSGDWTDHAGEVAGYAAGSWLFTTPLDGMRLYDRSGQQVRLYAGGWQAPAAIAAPSGGSTVDTEARDAIGAILTALGTAGILPAA